MMAGARQSRRGSAPPWWVALAVASMLAGSAVAQDDPRDIVVNTAGAVADRLEGRRGYFRDNPEELYALIDEILLPNFDIRYAGYRVMGEANWKAATKEQRNRFIDAFYQFMLRSYATGLLQLDPDSLKIDPEFRSNDRFAAVQTTIMQDTGALIPVNYRLRRSKRGWRVYDVRIEGVSYVENYSNQFAAEIDALGLDAVIDRLQAEVDKMSDEPTPVDSS
jgi:phospholipid transport system substrate-binding protein